jgi:hypothetical protein
MAQNTILAAGTTAATSTDVVVAAGSTVTIGIFVSSGDFSVSGPIVQVMADTPGADVSVATLSPQSPTAVIAGPGTFRAKRMAVSQSIGVYTET